jgi:hypothetical protein
MRRILTALLFGVGILAAPLIAQAAPCSPSMTFTTGQTLTASVLNSNPATFSGCFSNIDYTNIGAAGIFASQMMPTNASQATFGGGQNYTFPNNLTVLGTLTAATLGGLYPSSLAPTTTGQGTFGGSVPITFPNGTISQGAVQQTVSGTTYTIPYDVNSTAGSTATHFESGTLTTATFSGGFACVSHNFQKTFPSATPRMFYTLEGLTGLPTSAFVNLYTNGRSATSFQACAEAPPATSSGSATFDWLAISQ